MTKTPDPAPLALLYVRVSTGRQAKTGHSVDSQPVILRTAAEKAGYVVEVITETGSGRNAARPALAEAMSRLKSGKAQALYAVDIDRLARSTQHLLEIATASTKQGWRLVVTTTDVDTSTPAGVMFFTMCAAFAQYESGMISQRVKRQHEARRDRGVVWGKDEGRRSALPAATVARILSLRAEGRTLQAIADALTGDNVPTAAGGRWYPSTIVKTLNSPANRPLLAA
ncbi:recombinase family protein [Cryobacterium sp. PH31-L1]|uniref:recombinase family protein n=1 Tax=Cryobacterium sp. PH31-L1 TaxID=3046199 RepID=UPI0024BB17C8|nr:recombinase family protein [Cryobacterium sp. PH31-L1]MDJ0378915.1 recombinase family protein [Cryobacterium sp. PH31-L1]